MNAVLAFGWFSVGVGALFCLGAALYLVHEIRAAGGRPPERRGGAPGRRAYDRAP